MGIAKPIDAVHERLIFGRRVQRLASLLAAQLPPKARVLDIGCGDGSLAATIMQIRPDVTVTGVDVLVRPTTHIPVEAFDGQHVPADDNSYDVVSFVDVLHHTDDAAVLLAEASRVASKLVVIKDHLTDGLLSEPTLRFMDWVGNARHGVRLPYNYLSEEQWQKHFAQAGLTIASWNTELSLYPIGFSQVFDRKLHVVIALVPQPPG